jgi:predicted transcriptional regulator
MNATDEFDARTAALLQDPKVYQFARESLNLSISRIAQLLGVTRTTIYLREAGRSAISFESALAMLALTVHFKIILQLQVKR